MSEYTQRLAAAVEMITAHPHIPTPCVWGYANSNTVTVQWQLMHGDAKDDQRNAAAAIRKAIGGTWEKSGNTSAFDLHCTIDGVLLQILADREQVCERVVVGTETVTIPAVEAQPERTEEREVVEWRCEPLLAEVAS